MILFLCSWLTSIPILRMYPRPAPVAAPTVVPTPVKMLYIFLPNSVPLASKIIGICLSISETQSAIILLLAFSHSIFIQFDHSRLNIYSFVTSRALIQRSLSQWFSFHRRYHHCMYLGRVAGSVV